MLELVYQTAELVHLDAELGGPQVGVLLGGDRNVAQPTVVVSQAAVLLIGAEPSGKRAPWNRKNKSTAWAWPRLVPRAWSRTT